MASHLILDDTYPEVLADIAREIHMQLMNHPLVKLPHPIAAEVALGVAEKVRHNIGGVAVYIPRGRDYELSLRDKQMWADFKGDNYGELARKYEKSEMRIRQIMERIGKCEKSKRQQNLFEPSG